MRYCFTLLVIFAIFLACIGKGVLVMYEGDRRPASEVATIDIGNVYVMSVDTLTRKYQAISDNFIEVLPGRHELSVNYKSWKGRSHQPIHLAFTAESGHTYLVKARAGLRHWTAWVIDNANDSIVAGTCELGSQ